MDFKKTILWAVFSLSGLMLYNNWQVHEGKPSMFAGSQQNVSPAISDKSCCYFWRHTATSAHHKNWR